jgi:hypothetical protein
MGARHILHVDKPGDGVRVCLLGAHHVGL